MAKSRSLRFSVLVGLVLALLLFGKASELSLYADRESAALISWISGQPAGVIESYLNTHPRIRSWVLLEIDEPGVWLGYEYWSQAWKDRLEQMYQYLANDQPLPIPKPVPLALRSGDPSRVGYANLDVGQDVYFAQVAHSLYLEINGLVPWRLSDYTDEELSYLLPSSNYFTAYKGTDGQLYYVVYMGGTGGGSENIHRDPRDGFSFMQQEPEEGKSLIGLTRSETAMNLTEWFHDYLWHWPLGINPRYYDTYQAYPYLADRLQRLTVDGLGDVYVAIAGCWSACALFVDLMRSVNIPILKTTVMMQTAEGGSEGPHCGLMFDWQGGATRYLAHTDDIYHTRPFFDPAPGPGASRGQALWEHVWLGPNDFGTMFTYDPRPDVLATASWEQGQKYLRVSPWLIVSYDEAVTNACYLGTPNAVVEFLQSQRGFTLDEALRAWEGVERALLGYGEGDLTKACDVLATRHQAWCQKTGKCK